jgi:hypothetical protein
MTRIPLNCHKSSLNISTDFVGGALPCYAHCLRLAFASLKILSKDCRWPDGRLDVMAVILTFQAIAAFYYSKDAASVKMRP